MDEGIAGGGPMMLLDDVGTSGEGWVIDGVGFDVGMSCSRSLFVRIAVKAVAECRRAGGRVVSSIKDLATWFYYQKYFEWGLPARRFAQVNIETNTNCTRRCHFCWFGIEERPESVRMPAKLFFKIIDELVEIDFVGRLSLFSLNEPLTDNRIYSFLQYSTLMLPGCCHLLVTNGDLLTVEKLDALFDAGLDRLYINSYDVDALAHNVPLHEYAKEFHPGKVEHVDRTQYLNWGGRAGNVKQYAKAPVSGYCDWPNYLLYVKPDGRVLACCHDFEGVNTVGNLMEQSVEAAWFGSAFSKLRRSLNRGDRSMSELCSQCDHEPDLNYFRTNHLMPYVHGKSGWFWKPKPSDEDRLRAVTVKRSILAREDRSAVDGATTQAREVV